MSVKTLQFNDNSIHVITHNGEPCFIAAEVAEALGYSDPKGFTRKITRDWSDEFQACDFFKVEDENLSEIRSAVSESHTALNIHYNTRSLLLLTRSGVNLACVLARTEQGRAFRRWLVDEVLPALQQSGSYSLSGDSVPVECNPRVAALQMRTLDKLKGEGLIDRFTYSAHYIDALELARGRTIPQIRAAYHRQVRALATGEESQQLSLLDTGGAG